MADAIIAKYETNAGKSHRNQVMAFASSASCTLAPDVLPVTLLIALAVISLG